MKISRSLTFAFLMALAQPALADTTLIVSEWVPNADPAHKVLVDWCDEVAKVTAGRVKCNILPKPVASPARSADAVRDGLADVSTTIDGYTPTPPVLGAITGVPFPPVEANGEAVSAAYQRIFDKYFAKFKEHKGLKVLAVWSGSPSAIYTSSKAIRSADDIQGLKIQANNPDAVAFLKAMGAVPVAKPISESYEMLSSGITDGMLAPISPIRSYRLDKHVKHVNSTPILCASISLFMNANTWEKLSVEDQAAIEKVSGERLSRTFGRGFDWGDGEARGLLKANNVVPAPLPDAVIKEWQARAKPLEAAWIEAAKNKGLANPEQVLAEFRAEIVKVARELR